MEIDIDYFNQRRKKASDIFALQKSIYNPCLECPVIFNSDGFHHLQFSARSERDKKE